MIHGHRAPRCFSKDTPFHLRVCKAGYPQPECPVTVFDERGNPHYRRRFADEDEFVVPHNASLLLRYDARINVGLAHTVNIIKYLHK